MSCCSPVLEINSRLKRGIRGLSVPTIGGHQASVRFSHFTATHRSENVVAFAVCRATHAQGIAALWHLPTVDVSPEDSRLAPDSVHPVLYDKKPHPRIDLGSCSHGSWSCWALESACKIPWLVFTTAASEISRQSTLASLHFPAFHPLPPSVL